jgi:FkbM family methyltransferase
MLQNKSLVTFFLVLLGVLLFLFVSKTTINTRFKATTKADLNTKLHCPEHSYQKAIGFLKTSLCKIPTVPLCVWPPNDDIWISKGIIEHQGWTTETNEIFRQNVICDAIESVKQMKNIYSSFIGEYVILDIGANIGTFSLPLAADFASDKRVKIIAFEAFEKNYQLLDASRYLNTFGRKVSPALPTLHLVHKAVGANSASSVCLRTESTNQGGTAVDWKSASSRGALDKCKYRIEQTTLDTELLPLLLSKKDIVMRKVAVLKIDCQGCEGRAIEGMQKILSNKKLKPLVIYIETREKAILDLLEAKYGYKKATKLEGSAPDDFKFIWQA